MRLKEGPEDWVGFAFTNQPIHWGGCSDVARLIFPKQLPQLGFFNLAIRPVAKVAS
jgi:hypothetical protein